MIINKFNKYLKLLLLIILFSSCDFCDLFNINNKKEKDNEPVYKANVVWRSDVKTVKYRTGTQEGRYLYLYEDPKYFGGNDSDFRLKKIDTETGETIWVTDDFPIIQLCVPVIIENIIYVAIKDSFIYCIEKNTGNIVGIIQTDTNDEEMIMRSNLISYKNYLYFGFGNSYINKNYLARINTDNLNFFESNESAKMQMIEPEIVWTSKYGNSRVFANPVFKDDMVFLMTYVWNTNNLLEFVALNITNNNTVWINLIDYDDGRSHLFINDDIIYMMSEEVSAYRITDGNRLEFIINNDNCPAPGLNSKGTVYYNGKLYYTNGWSSGGGKNTAPNIVCLDAETGNFVWGDLPYGSGSFGPVPVIYHGILFYTCANGLRVYNANTGKLLGVDKTSFILSGNQGTMFLYEDLLVFPDASETKDYYSYIAVDISEWAED